MHRARSFNRLPSLDEAMSAFAATPRLAPPSPTERPLHLYGAGNLGTLAREFLTAVGHELAGIFERGDPIPEAGARVAVSVVTSPYVTIERSLAARGCIDVVPFYDLAESLRGQHPLSNGWFAEPLTAVDQFEIEGVHAGWADDVSRAHHLQFLAWRRLREEWTFETAPIPACSRFFIPEVVDALQPDECLLDGGAHHGTVIEAFVKQTNGCFRQIVAIEPDPFNRALLIDNLRSSLPDNPDVKVYDCVLADDENSMLFHEGLGYASQLSPTGQMRVMTRPLDTLGLSPTFLKLHLEGAELLALKGARATLLS